MGMVKLMSDNEAGDTAVDYTVELVGAADEITGKIVNGDVDIAAVPCNLASVLYNKTEGRCKNCCCKYIRCFVYAGSQWQVRKSSLLLT